MSKKIRCVHDDGRVMFYVPEMAFDRMNQKSLKFIPEPLESEDTEAVALAEKMNRSAGKIDEGGSAPIPTLDEANKALVDSLTGTNKAENERIDAEEKEFSAENDQIENETSFPLEINDEDAPEQDVIPAPAPENISGKVSAPKVEERPKAKPRR